MEYRLTVPRLSAQQQELFMRIGLVLLALVVVMTPVLLVLTRSHHRVPMRLRGGACSAERFRRRDAQLYNATSCHLTAMLLKVRLSVPGDQHPPTTVDQRRPPGRRQVPSSSAKAASLYSRCLAAWMEHHATFLVALLRYLGLGTFDDAENPANIRADANDTEPQARNVQSIAHRIIITEEVVLGLTALIPDDDPDRYYATVSMLRGGASMLDWPPSLTVYNLSEVAVGHPLTLGYHDFLTYDVPPHNVTDYLTWELVRQLGLLADPW
ncbi:hypothetical protein MTO96_025866 [Rhipicephalus appendiculatus]